MFWNSLLSLNVFELMTVISNVLENIIFRLLCISDFRPQVLATPTADDSFYFVPFYLFIHSNYFSSFPIGKQLII